MPIAFFIDAILSMFSIFRTKTLGPSIQPKKQYDLISKTCQDILLYEIDANTNSYNKNMVMTEMENKSYSRGVCLTTIDMFISIILLLANKSIAIETIPAKVQIMTIGKQTHTKKNIIKNKFLLNITSLYLIIHLIMQISFKAFK